MGVPSKTYSSKQFYYNYSINGIANQWRNRHFPGISLFIGKYIVDKKGEMIYNIHAKMVEPRT